LRLATELWTTFQDTDLSAIDAPTGILLLRQAVAMALGILLITFLIIRDPARARAKGLLPRLAAFGGAYVGVAVVLLPHQPIGLTLSLVSLLLMLAGAAFSVYSISHLGRSFSVMPEARQLVTDGPYARIRHPLYLGEAVSFLGLTLQYLSLFAITIFAVQIGFQLVRMKHEESVLSGLFPEYLAYKLRTARLVPGIY
jgi:protein-S-isoprenylcysteine O-methyltransferase Ste14